MEEVSSRIFAFYSEAVARRGGSAETLAQGHPSIERVLHGGAVWYDWTDHVRMLERFQSAIGGPAAAEQASLEANERRVAERLRLVARSIADLSLLYRAGFWFAGSLYRHVHFSVQMDGHVLRIDITFPERYEGSEIFFRMWRGALRGMPRMLGLPDATVSSEIGPHRGVFHVLLPEGRDVLSHARHLLRSARTGAALLTQVEKHERELRAAYDTLLRSRQDFREIGQNTPDALMLLRSGAVVYANPAALAAIGEGELGKAVEPGDRHAVEAWLAEAEEHGSAGRIDFRIGVRTFEAEAARAVDFDADGAILVVARDVSDRHAADERLRSSERDKRALLEAVPDLIVRLRNDGAIADVAGQASHRMASLLRSRIGEPLQSVADELAQLPVDLALRLVDGAASVSPEAFVLETPVYLQDERLCLEWRSVAIEGGAIVCLVRDLSRQRQMEADLAVAERLASLGMLAAGVGHEINNPLTYLLLHLRHLDSAIRAGKTATDFSTHVTTALEGARHIERVVRSLKALAQRAPGEDHPVDVNAVIGEMLRLTENRVPAGTRVFREHDADVFALADEGPLGQVIANLFVNAIDAIVDVGGAGVIRLATRARGEFVEIEITDDGIGMSAQAAAHAFDPFFTTKPASGGSGLGLTLAHRIVTALGGTITMRRVVPRGTAVVVRLPRAPSPAKVGATVEPAAPRFEGASVLVIDDQPNLVRTLRILLDECKVTSALCGAEALAAIESSPFDAVLCDIVMPDIDGRGIFERLEQQAPALLPRLVFMSGGATRPEISEFLEADPDSPFAKAVHGGRAPPRARASDERTAHRTVIGSKKIVVSDAHRASAWLPGLRRERGEILASLTRVCAQTLRSTPTSVHTHGLRA